MTELELRVAQIREGWEWFWTAESPGALWADPPDRCTFVPFDSHEILEGRDCIADWLLRRRRSQRLVGATWRDLARWPHGDTIVCCAELEFSVVPAVPDEPAGSAPAAPELRTVRVLAAVQASGAGIRFRHLAEASPAALVEMIGDYHAHAAPEQAS